MGFTKPSDIAVILGIGLLVILTVTLGVESVQNKQNVTQTNSVFTTAASTSLTTFQNTSNTASGALTTSPGQTEANTETNIYVASFDAILSLGEMISSSINLLTEFTKSLNLPTYFITIIMGIILVIFAVITYSWFRGGNLS